MHIFHSWSKWRDIGKAQDGDILQQRTCRICDKKQLKWAQSW